MVETWGADPFVTSFGFCMLLTMSFAVDDRKSWRQNSSNLGQQLKAVAADNVPACRINLWRILGRNKKPLKESIEICREHN